MNRCVSITSEVYGDVTKHAKTSWEAIVRANDGRPIHSLGCSPTLTQALQRLREFRLDHRWNVG